MKGVSLYVFGSYLTSDSPNDIDLLWVYEADVDVRSVMAYIRGQEARWSGKFERPFHSSVLSAAEESAEHFVSMVGAKKIGSIDELLPEINVSIS